MKSMTGYGWGEDADEGFKVTVELSSVNRKQGEITVNLPRELEVLEAQIRDRINRVVARGRITARVSLHVGEGMEAARVHVRAPGCFRGARRRCVARARGTATQPCGDRARPHRERC